VIAIPGSCINCGTRIANGTDYSKYNEVIFRLSDGSNLTIAVCADCEISEDQYPEMIAAVNDGFKAQGSDYQLTSEITGIVDYVSSADLILMKQGGRCLSCQQPIGKNYCVTNGIMLHEMCPIPIQRMVGDTLAAIPQDVGPIDKAL